MLTRAVITAALANMPAGVDVIPFARNIAAPRQPTVMVRIDKVTPAGPGGLWDVEAALVVIAAKQTGQAAEEQLEATLADVLKLLDTDPAAAGLFWTQATRATYAPDEDSPTNPAYEVAVITRTYEREN